MKRSFTAVIFCVIFLFVKFKGTYESEDVVTIDEVKKLKDNATVLFIDVREHHELTQTGHIPGSINIPLNQLRYSLKEMSDEEFKEKYGRARPNFETPIVFTCKSGNRSEKAMNMARGLGYGNVKHYKGGWIEWDQAKRIEDL